MSEIIMHFSLLIFCHTDQGGSHFKIREDTILNLTIEMKVIKQ